MTYAEYAAKADMLNRDIACRLVGALKVGDPAKDMIIAYEMLVNFCKERAELAAANDMDTAAAHWLEDSEALLGKLGGSLK